MTETIRRRRTDPPTEPGHYYARLEGPPSPERTIQPVRVFAAVWSGDHLRVRGAERSFPLSYFTWYGPVPEVEEAPAPPDVDFSATEIRCLGHLIAAVEGYVSERSKVSSRHKLATFDELVQAHSVAMILYGDRPALDDRGVAFLREVVDGLIKQGRLIEYAGGFLSTEPKGVE
jgi:hypothetical protein